MRLVRYALAFGIINIRTRGTSSTNHRPLWNKWTVLHNERQNNPVSPGPGYFAFMCRGRGECIGPRTGCLREFLISDDINTGAWKGSHKILMKELNQGLRSHLMERLCLFKGTTSLFDVDVYIMYKVYTACFCVCVYINSQWIIMVYVTGWTQNSQTSYACFFCYVFNLHKFIYCHSHLHIYWVMLGVNMITGSLHDTSKPELTKWANAAVCLNGATRGRCEHAMT